MIGQFNASSLGDSPSPFTTLPTDQIHAKLTRLQSMLRSSYHIHDWNMGLVEPFDDLFRRNSNSTNKQSGLFFNNHIDKLVELATGIILMMSNMSVNAQNPNSFGLSRRMTDAQYLVGLPGGAAHLWNE